MYKTQRCRGRELFAIEDILHQHLVLDRFEIQYDFFA